MPLSSEKDTFCEFSKCQIQMWPHQSSKNLIKDSSRVIYNIFLQQLEIIVLQQRTWADFFSNLYLRVFLKSLVATYRKECISIHTNSYHLPRAYFCQVLNYVLYMLCSFTSTTVLQGRFYYFLHFIGKITKSIKS